MSISYLFLREFAQNIPKVRDLLIERKQIEVDYYKDITYNKLDYTLKPSWAKKLPPRTYKNDKSKDQENREKYFKEQLENNAKEIEKALHTHCKETNLETLIENYKEFSANELPTFIEKGRDQVLKDREAKKHQKQKPRTFDQTQKDFKKEILSFNSEFTKQDLNNSQELMKNRIEDFRKSQNQEKLKEQNNKFDQAYEKLRESQFKENQKEIEQKRDRGFKR
ncbi:hypothetical protein EZY14_004200 [Kordia sp. TARA_039_SRF]|nr:hypothetical protein EZY14_004200 [Kordia sp. TARA_039_SRF]